MNFCQLHSLTGIALFSAVLMLPVTAAQEATSDPFLDAMLQDTAGQTTGTSGNSGSSTTSIQVRSDTPDEEVPQAVRNEQADEQQPPAPQQEAPQTRLINRAQDARMVDEHTVLRELGEKTGLGIMGQQENFDGRRVASVNIRYARGKANVPNQRLLDVIQTSRGSKYSTQRINDDLERLLQKGLVGNNAWVEAKAAGSDAVQVTFVVEPSGLLGGVGSRPGNCARRPNWSPATPSTTTIWRRRGRRSSGCTRMPATRT